MHFTAWVETWWPWGRGVLTWTGGQADAPGRQTHWRTDRRTARGSGTRRPGRSGSRAGMDSGPGETDRERKGGGGGGGGGGPGRGRGGRERASREEGPGREGEEGGSVPGRVPAGDLGGSRARPPHARGPGGQGMEGRGHRPWKPRLHPALRVLPTHGAPTHQLSSQNTLPTPPNPPTQLTPNLPLMKLLLIISNSSTNGALIPCQVPC